MGFLSRSEEVVSESPTPAHSPFLRTLQTCLRALQLTAAVVVLAIYSYTLAALSNRGLKTPTEVRAVEGIVGITVAYTLACIVLLRVFSTRTFPAFVLIVLDVTFAAAWIYVATANGGGSSCSGEVKSHFGKGKAEDDVTGKKDGFMALPKFGDACRLLSACLAISIISIFMFLGSVATTIFLGRAHHAQKRKTISSDSLEEPYSYPPLDSPKIGQEEPAKGKFSLKNLFRRGTLRAPAHNENTLPSHVQPSDLSSGNEQGRHYGYDDSHGGATESDLGLVGGGRGYQRVPATQDRPASPETVYAEYEPRRHTPPPAISHQLREDPYSHQLHEESYANQLQEDPYSHQLREEQHPQDIWRPVNITGGLQSVDMGDGQTRFPQGPYENLRGSVRSGYQGAGQGRPPPPGYRYGDGVYDA